MAGVTATMETDDRATLCWLNGSTKLTVNRVIVWSPRFSSANMNSTMRSTFSSHSYAGRCGRQHDRPTSAARRACQRRFTLWKAGAAVMDYDGYFADALIRLRNKNRYRVLTNWNG
jgi:hypothetical protein